MDLPTVCLQFLLEKVSNDDLFVTALVCKDFYELLKAQERCALKDGSEYAPWEFNNRIRFLTPPTGICSSFNRYMFMNSLGEHGPQWENRACEMIAKVGSLELLKAAHAFGCEWKRSSKFAASSGNLDCLKYVLEQQQLEDGDRFKRRTDTCEAAACDGQLACLKYAREKGCGWDEDTCMVAAENGQLECLKYAHENGCPWSKYTCLSAAANGHLECLKYAHENGCPWDELTCWAAAEKGHLDCLEYAREHGCPE
eukprot:COSAG02_NODE_6347_length_3633_cov_1.777023_2_plen_255_part_00